VHNRSGKTGDADYDDNDAVDYGQENACRCAGDDHDAFVGLLNSLF